MAQELQISRADLAETRLVARRGEPGDGEAAFAVERFALTANNITYAAHGVDMRYWDFFPAPDGWGIVPVWGFARVVASRVDGLADGDRIYGYWPFADGAVLRPVKVSPRGFVDGAEHRRGLAAVYNGYARVTPEMADEAAYALFRPLYLTSFLLDIAYAGAADNLLIASASSKTALGLAQSAKRRGGALVVGLTSKRNIGFCEATGYYDAIAAYEAVGDLDLAGGVAFADFAGNGALREAVHARFTGRLKLSLVIGDTDWASTGKTGRLAGPRPEPFFAPSVLHEQIAARGQAAFDAQVAAGWVSFTASTEPWLRIVEINGLAAAQAAYARVLDGQVDPAEGLIVRP